MNVIFDTNTVYYLDSKLSNAEFSKLKSKVENGLKVFISPLTVIEITSRIKGNPKDFVKVQGAVKKLFELNPTFLPDPEMQLREYILNTKIDPNNYTQWEEIFYSIAVAPDSKLLETGFDDMTTLTKRKVNYSFICSFRADYETDYVLDMETILQSIIPDFDKKVKKGKNIRLRKNAIADFENYLLSKRWNDQIKLMLMNRTSLCLPSEQIEISCIIQKIRFFKIAYENLLRKVFKEGYLPNIKKKNDYNDCHFTVYFHDDNNFIFITSEKNILFKELLDNSRCCTIDDLV